MPPAGRAGIRGSVHRTLPGWLAEPVAARLAAPVAVRGFAAFAAAFAGVAVDAGYVVAARSQWGAHLAGKLPASAAGFRAEAASFGFAELEIDKMWSKLAQISVITAIPPDLLTAEQHATGRAVFCNAVVANHHGRRPKTLATPLFGLDAVMFHRGQAPAPQPRREFLARSTQEVTWAQIAARAPWLATTMRRYLDQLGLSLRASSVTCVDTTLRQLAGMLIACHPEDSCVAEIDRGHIEAFKTWLAGRPPRLPQTTGAVQDHPRDAHGHLRSFFERIAEWGSAITA